MSKIKQNYDQIYHDKKIYWGLKPTPLVVKITERIHKKGRILDLGSGEGRNALYLAKKGFSVTVVDFSEKGIEKSKRMAEEQGLEMEYIVGDVSSTDLESKLGDYDAIICINTLQFLNPEKVDFVLDYMKEHTLPKGYHAVVSFLAENELIRERQISKGRYRFREGELADRYKGWTILPEDYKESLGPWHTHDGPKHRHYLVNLIAQKPSLINKRRTL